MKTDAKKIIKKRTNPKRLFCQVETLISQHAKLFKADSEYIIEYLHQGFIDWAHTNVPEWQGDGAQEVLDATIQIIKDCASA